MQLASRKPKNDWRNKRRTNVPVPVQLAPRKPNKILPNDVNIRAAKNGGHICSREIQEFLLQSTQLDQKCFVAGSKLYLPGG